MPRPLYTVDYTAAPLEPAVQVLTVPRLQEFAKRTGLCVQDLKLAAGALIVRGGKGAKDGPGVFGGTTAALLRAWLTARRRTSLEDHVFCDRQGRPLSRDV